MATWPDLAALKQTLDVSGDDWDGEHHLTGVLAAAIEQVKLDVGDWDDVSDSPDDALAQAALLMAVRVAKAPGEGQLDLTLFREDVAYERLLKGHRRRFTIA